MTRFLFHGLRYAVDLGVLSAAYLIAFAVRFDGQVPAEMIDRGVATVVLAVGIQYFILAALGVPRFSWRHVGLREAMRIGLAVGLGTLALLSLRLTLGYLLPAWPSLQRFVVPMGVLCINAIVAFFGTVGVRMLRRLLAERAARSSRLQQRPAASPVLLVGAGQAGLLVARELGARPDLGLKVVGFIDDDALKKGTSVHGIRVLGSTDELPRFALSTGAKQALITIANAPGKELRRIAARCEQAQLSPKVVPGLYEVVGGGADLQLNLANIRGIRIEDLLRREPVQLDREAIRHEVHGKVVMVTGAGGSIGSELCRQIAQFRPAQLLLVERAETSLFHIHRELLEAVPEVPVLPIVADIVDRRRMRKVFAAQRVDMVLHAAAYKHVPLMEHNPREAVHNNIFGTQVVADLAHEFQVERFVLISTDKAVHPTSVMGASKRVAEILVQAWSQRSRTQFVAVRFGNVLGSAGSVVPIFQEQIARGGPVTITHPEMRRYFMTIPEACQLVLQASVLGKGGEIFILDMGEPVKIVDLAHDLITLSGLRPGHDVEVVFTGLRPGEKLYEELSVADENASRTQHPKIFIGKLRPSPWAGVARQLEELHQQVDAEVADEALCAKLADIVPESHLRLVDSEGRRRLGDALSEALGEARSQAADRLRRPPSLAV